MKYAITVNEVKDSPNGLKGFASVTLGDSFKIINVVIMENAETKELFVSMPRVVLQIIYSFMLHFIYNHFQDYPKCHITLFKPDYAHKILLSKTKHIILTRMRLLTARTFGFSVMFD